MIFSEIYEKANGYALIAKDFYDLKRYKDSLNSIILAISLFNNESFNFNQGLILSSLKHKSAWEEFKKVYLLSFRQDLEAFFCMGITRFHLGHYKIALNVFQKVQKRDLNYEPCYCAKIAVYIKMSYYESAKKIFYLAQNLNQDCQLCFYNIACVALLEERYDQAIHCWEKILSYPELIKELNFYKIKSLIETASLLKRGSLWLSLKEKRNLFFPLIQLPPWRTT